MKSFALAFLVIVASATALPQYNEAETREERLVADAIIAVVNQASQKIQEAGLDPVLIDRAEYNYVLLPLLAEVNAFVDNLQFTGLSNIAVNNADYSVLLGRLRFDISLPEIRVSVGNSAISVDFFGLRTESSLRGLASVRQIRVAGEARINVGIITGISIRSLEINFSVGAIESDIYVNVFGRDISGTVNKFFNENIPNFLAQNQNEINQLLERIVLEVVDSLM